MLSTTGDRTRSRRRRVTVASATSRWWLVLAVASGAIPFVVLGGKPAQAVGAVAVETACGVAAVVTIGRRVRQAGWQRRPLAQGGILVAAGLLGLLGADAFALPAHLGTGRSAAGRELVVIAVTYPLLYFGMVALLRARSSGHELDGLLEALLVPAVLEFVLGSAVSRRQDLGLVAVVRLLRPGLDLVAFLLAARLAEIGPGRRSSTPWRGLAVAAGLQLVADSLRAAPVIGGPAAPGRVIGGLLLGGWAVLAAAGVHPEAGLEAEPVAVPRGRLSLPRLGIVMAAVLVGPSQLVIDVVRRTSVHVSQIATGTVILSGLAVAFLVRLIEEGGRIEHLALHDDLTGLPNRLLFAHRVEAAVGQAEREGQAIAVMFLDLDRFKTINDSLGHAAGNDLLRLVGHRLRHAVREEDTVARLGGDEFSVLLPGIAGPDEIGPPIDRLMAAFTDPFRIAGRDLFVSPSIGVAVGPADGRDVDTLVRNADAAMYRAKAAGRQTFRLFTPDMNAEAHRRLTLESSLHTAIERGELVLHYQPKVDLRTGMLIGMEALARWNHAEQGLLLPDDFIPLAEETGLIVPLGEWALETACTQTRVWREEGHDLTVAVNLSARQFHQQHMADLVAGVLRRTGLAPHALELELTESVALEDPHAITATLHDIKGMGVSCSIDDFGTGYSGLSYLTRLPIDALKIDKAFVAQIADGEDDARIVAAVIALAHQLHMKVIAEGVETEHQMSFLREHGCDVMQGYLVSKPVPPEEFARLLVTPGAARLEPDRPASARRGVRGPWAALRVGRLG